MNKFFLFGLAGLLCLTACKAKPKQVSSLNRAQAAQNASEADFALQIHDYPRADKLLADATKLDPDVPRYWKALGSARKHEGDVKGAREAYERSLGLLKTQATKSENFFPALMGEFETCALLGKKDDAVALLNQALHDHPDDQQLKSVVDHKVLDQIFANPQIHDSAL